MQPKLLRDIVSSVVGQSAAQIVDLLYGKKNVNEFLIAKKLVMTINQARNVLYKLADEGLVSFVRKKDKRKGGWYTYFWTLNSGKGLIKFRENLKHQLEGLGNKLQSKKFGRFFYCPNCDMQFNEEGALLHNYACPECGEVLQLKDSSQEISETEGKMNALVELFKEVNREIDVIQAAEDRSKKRRLKVEERKKVAKRLEKKREREKLSKGSKEKKSRGVKKSSKKQKKSKKRR